MKDWTKTSSKHCSVCDDTKNLVYVRDFMMCPKHDNQKTINDCEALRSAQKAMNKELNHENKVGQSRKQALSTNKSA